MIYLKPNANQIINNLVYQDGVIAYYYSVCERYANGYIQLFITDLQNLITKLGIIISKVSTSRVNISYCRQSLDYLCRDVIDSPQIRSDFERLGLNDKGNRGKHDIVTNKINLDQCVSTFNNLVNTISHKYNLPSLKTLIIVKRVKNKTNNKEIPERPNKYVDNLLSPNEGTKTNNQTQPKQKPPKQKRHAQETATTNDEKLTLRAELCRGDGRYTKGLFKKVPMLNFVLNIKITNPNSLRITSVTAEFKCGKNTTKQKISTDLVSKTQVDLETSKFSGNIEASIIVVYKIGLTKTKQLKATVSKNF